MADDRRWIVSLMFIAVPDLISKENTFDLLAKAGLITEREAQRFNDIRIQIKRSKRIIKGVGDSNYIDTIMAIVPEILTPDTVNFFRLMGIIDKKEAQALRIFVRTLNAIGPPSRLSMEEAAKTAARVLGAATSFESVDLAVTLGFLTPEQANKYRAAITAKNVAINAVKQYKRGNTVMSALIFTRDAVFSNATIRVMQLSGLIDAGTAANLKDLLRLGRTAWNQVGNAVNTKGIQARLLIGAQGIVNQELVNVLLRNGIISKKDAELLRAAVLASRTVARRRLDKIQQVSRPVRVVSGEAPVKTFARVTRVTDDYILRLLAESAGEARDEAIRLQKLGGFGNKTRAAQFRLSQNALYGHMRALYEGVGSLTIFGEREAAAAAVESMTMLQQKLFKSVGKQASEELARQAAAGIDSFVSREENLVDLSSRVYLNGKRSADAAAREIQKGLLRGDSAKEIANRVYQHINPKTPGGASYAAMRLARTEINNAFHWTSIRYTREMPWVSGYKWNLSGSHKRPDVCNTMATSNHSKLGAGVYSKDSVPGKPHPHCFCYVTTVTVSETEFVKGFRTGRYNRYMSTMKRGDV